MTLQTGDYIETSPDHLEGQIVRVEGRTYQVRLAAGGVYEYDRANLTYVPGPEEIRRECSLIQSEWTPAVEASRRVERPVEISFEELMFTAENVWV